MCDCEFSPEMADPDEESWHYKRSCVNCLTTWAGLHCEHDGIQNTCPGCGIVPEIIEESIYLSFQ